MPKNGLSGSPRKHQGSALDPEGRTWAGDLLMTGGLPHSDTKFFLRRCRSLDRGLWSVRWKEGRLAGTVEAGIYRTQKASGLGKTPVGADVPIGPALDLDL